MINRAAISQWRTQVPWNKGEQVEQDLIISRTLIAIFSDEFLANQLAFRGGTALHKLYFDPQSRYSEDIDLVQINAGPISYSLSIGSTGFYLVSLSNKSDLTILCCFA